MSEKERSVKLNAMGNEKNPDHKLQKRREEIIRFTMLISSLMTSCRTQGESWNQEVNQLCLAKVALLRKRIDSKEI